MTQVSYTRGAGRFENYLSDLRSKAANQHILNQHRSGRVLDIGCGAYPNFLCHTEFKEKFGLDRLPTDQINVQGIQLSNFDLETQTNLPFPDDFFDTVTMLAVFEHIEPAKLPAVLKEIFRVLKPGGQFILTTPTIWTNALLKYLAMAGLVSKEEIEEHKDAYTPKRISSALNQAGFDKDKLKTKYFELGMNILASAFKNYA